MMNKRQLLGLLTALWTTPIWAQNSTGNSVMLSNVQSDVTEISVDASRSRTKLESMPVFTTLITQEDIKKSPALTLDQLLRNISSVNLSGAPYYVSDPTGTSLKMRGLANAKVLVMLDGIPIHDPFYSTIQWFKVPLASIERVEVVRGGGSALWGNLAVAGVINIISKKPEGAGGEVSASIGNMNTQNLYAAKNLQVSEDLKVRISADYFHTDGYIPTPVFFNGSYKLSAGQVENSDKQANLRIDSYYQFDATTSGFFKLGYHEQNQYINNELGQNLQQAYDLSAGVTSQLSDNSTIDGKLWFQSIVFNKNNATGCWPGINTTNGLYAPTSSTYNSKCGTSFSVGVAPSDAAPIYKYIGQTDYQPYNEVGASLVYSNSNAIGNSTLGIDSRRLSAKDSQFNYNAPTVANGVVTVAPLVNTYISSQATQQFIGTFFQQKYRPIDEFEATLGLRLDSWTNSNANIMINNNSNPQDDKTTYSFNPSLSLKYFVDDNLSLRSSAYKGFRAPGMNNMYRSFGSTSSTSTSISNPNLSPENLYGWEVGADYQSSLVDLNITYYSLYVQNMNYSMALSNISTGVAAQYYSSVKSLYGITASSFNYYLDQFDSRSNGLELGSKWRLANNLSLIANYIYTNAFLTNTIDSSKNPAFKQLGGVSPNVGILGIDLKITPKIKTYWQARAVSQAYLDTAQTVQMPGYVTVDFSVAYDYDNKTTFTANGMNLLNQGYYTDGGSSSTTPTMGLPRLVMVGLRYKF